MEEKEEVEVPEEEEVITRMIGIQSPNSADSSRAERSKLLKKSSDSQSPSKKARSLINS